MPQGEAGVEEPITIESAFNPEPESVRAVRIFALKAIPAFDRLDDVVLVVSELASNVVRHAGTEYQVGVSATEQGVRLEVADGSSIVPAMQELTESQYGLRIIDSLADRWGIESTDDGKVAWAEFDVRAPSSLS